MPFVAFLAFFFRIRKMVFCPFRKAYQTNALISLDAKADSILKTRLHAEGAQQDLDGDRGSEFGSPDLDDGASDIG